MGTTPESASAVQALLALPLLVIGLSHIWQPKMWIEFFSYLHGLGTSGVVIRTFGLELVPAMLILAFHWVWSGPETVLSVYGVVLGSKVAVALLLPSVGQRSLSMADRKDGLPLLVAGILLVALSAVCFWALLA